MPSSASDPGCRPTLEGESESERESESESEWMSMPNPVLDRPVPPIVTSLSGGAEPRLVWHNELGGMTFRIGARFVKWNPRHNGVNLDRERIRLEWLAPRHPAPRVVDFGSTDDADWLLTEALPGEHAVGPRWRDRPSLAIRAIATGLRALHALLIDGPGDTLPIDAMPGWAFDSWVCRTPDHLGERPPVEDPVLVHGDACAPNTLVSPEGRWTGHVDLGDLAIGDRWADLAIAAMSLDWNFGEGHQDEFYDAYGITPDPRRIEYYRALWHAQS